MKTWLVTGCSTGFGRELANELLERGHRVAVTARDTARIEDFRDRYPERALVVPLDVTDPASIESAVASVEAVFGAIDVLVNNAGYGYRTAVEEGEPTQVAKLYETNLFGPIALIKRVLPGMRAQRSGAIVNLSSIAARIAPVGSGYYASAKAALEVLSFSLKKEVEPLGISVMNVEPGMFRTDFAGRSLEESPIEIEDYAETAGQRRIRNDHTHGTQPGDPRKGAAAIIDAIEAENPPAVLVLGADAVDWFRSSLEADLDSLNDWESVSRGVEFADD